MSGGGIDETSLRWSLSDVVCQVTRLTQELKTQHHQGQRVAEERDALKEKFTDMLLINRQQVTELSEQLHVLQAEHKGLVEQCSSQMVREFSKICFYIK